MAIKLIIFDLDGTLVDSSTDITNALNAAGKAYGMQSVTVKEAETLIGGGLNALIERLIARQRIDVDKAVLLKSFLDHYSSHLTDHTRPYPLVPETLSALEDTPMAVLSNKITSFTVEIVNRFGLGRYFSSIQGGDAVKEKKPAPGAILDLLLDFGTARDEAMMVGDSMYDIQAGRSAGTHTVAALYGYGASGFDVDAEFRIKNIAELPAIIHKFRSCIP